jgi:hypothetical protein
LTSDDQLADACIVAQSLNPPLLHVRIDEPGRTSVASSDLPVPRKLLPSATSRCAAFAELIAPLTVCRRIRRLLGHRRSCLDRSGSWLQMSSKRDLTICRTSSKS